MPHKKLLVDPCSNGIRYILLMNKFPRVGAIIVPPKYFLFEEAEFAIEKNSSGVFVKIRNCSVVDSYKGEWFAKFIFVGGIKTRLSVVQPFFLWIYFYQWLIV